MIILIVFLAPPWFEEQFYSLCRHLRFFRNQHGLLHKICSNIHLSLLEGFIFPKLFYSEGLCRSFCSWTWKQQTAKVQALFLQAALLCWCFSFNRQSQKALYKLFEKEQTDQSDHKQLRNNSENSMYWLRLCDLMQRPRTVPVKKGKKC